MKRKYSDKREADYILNKEFAMHYVNEPDFKGHVTLVKINEVKAPIYVGVAEHKLCLVNNGYIWMQHFPEGQEYSVLTMMDDQLKVIQWYYDIIKPYQLTEEGVPYYDDMYLDVVVLGNGEIYTFDEDELDQALLDGVITHTEHERATQASNNLLDEIKASNHAFGNVSQGHMKLFEAYF